MKLSRTASYAIQAMLHLAAEKTAAPVKCSQLASDGDMPERYLLEVLRDLVAHGLLLSTRGSDGGFALAKPAGQITLCEVFEVFDMPRMPSMPKPTGRAKVCRLVDDTLQRAFDAASAELKKVTIADLLLEHITNQSQQNISVGISGQRLSGEPEDDEVFIYAPPINKSA